VTKRRGYLRAPRPILLMSALLLVVVSTPRASAAAELYASAVIDDHGELRITTKDGKEIVPRKATDQVGFADARVSEDRRAVGWLAEFPNCCTSYPIALALIIRSNGRTRTYTGIDLAIGSWAFVEGGRRFVFRQETVHGGLGIHYELHDVETGRLVDQYSAEYDLDFQLLANQRLPRWAEELRPLY